MASRPSARASPSTLPPSAPATVPATHPTYCGAVEPNSSQRSNVPSPRPAMAHDASTTAWPCAARRSGPPGSDGPSAAPIGRKREFTSAAAMTAAATVPPEARIAMAVNCAAPAKTIADITMAASGVKPALLATTPKDSASSAPAIANGMPARKPWASTARRPMRSSSSITWSVPVRAPSIHEDRRREPSARLMRPAAALRSPPAGGGREVGVLPAAVGRVDVRAGRDDLVDAVQDRRVELDVGGAELRLEVIHRARPDDRRRHRRVVDHEGEREVDERQPRRLGELRELLGRLELALVRRDREVVAAGDAVGAARLRRLLPLAPAARQPAAAERSPRDDAHAVAPARRKHVVLDAADEQRVRRLLADEPLADAVAGAPPGPADLRRRARRGADVADLPLVDEVAQRAERLVDVGVRLGTVDLVEVDPVGVQAL